MDKVSFSVLVLLVTHILADEVDPIHFKSPGFLF